MGREHRPPDDATSGRREGARGMPKLTTHLFTIGVGGQSRTTILICSGRMVEGSIEILRSALAAAGTEAPVVELDLRQVSQIDRGAAAALLQARQELAGHGRELRLLVSPPMEDHLLRLGAAAPLDAPPSGDAKPSRRARGDEKQEAPGRTDPPESEE